MEVYHGAVRDIDRYTPLSDLQTAAAERLNQIDEEEKAFELTTLAGQTKNAESIEKSAKIIGNAVAEHLIKLPRYLENTLSDALNNLNRLVNVPQLEESLAATTRGITTAASTIDTASRTMKEASYRMSN